MLAARFAASAAAAPARRCSRAVSPWHIHRVRPNQALQRTGSVPGFTVLPQFQLRRRPGRPLNASSLGRTHSGLVLLRTCASSPTRGPSRVSASGAHGPRRGRRLRVQPVQLITHLRRSPRCVLRRGSAPAAHLVAPPAVFPLRSAAWRSSRLKLHSALGQGAALFHVRRVRPNQALQRTGSVRGFTLLPRNQPVVGLAGR